MPVMARPGLRNAVVFSTFAALLALILRSLRSAPLPSSATATGGTAPSTTMAPASADSAVARPDAVRDDRGSPGPAATQTDAAAPTPSAPTTPEPVPVADTLPGIGGVDPLIAEGEPEVAAGAELPDWIAATDEDPPATHLVKAKLASRIYRVPGGAGYDRAKPDRWYRSAQAAEADGLRAAKR
jgi:large subunit ribosomal protein L17